MIDGLAILDFASGEIAPRALFAQVLASGHVVTMVAPDQVAAMLRDLERVVSL